MAKKQKTKFKGEVIVKWLKDGRRMKLQEDFSFVDKNGATWTAPAGSVIGSPFAGRYRRASVPRCGLPEAHQTLEKGLELGT